MLPKKKHFEGSDICASYLWGQLLFVATIVTFSFTVLINPLFASTQPDGRWSDLQNRGSTALDANEYWLAEPLLQQAMAQADLFNPKDLRLAKSLSELGRLYTVRGRFDEAEVYLEEELSIRELVLGNDRYKCIPTMGALIQFYLTNGTHSKAYPLTDEMLDLVEGKLDEARSGSYKVKVQKGVPIQGWLGVAAPKMQDPIIEWAITCDAVGKTHQAVGNFKLAERFFKVALDIKATVLGNNHLSLANSYDSLGSLYLEKKDLAEAESYFADALQITEKTLGSESREVFNRLDKLAKCLIKAGKYSQAEALYHRAQTFWKKEPSQCGNEARVLYALGSLYTQEHRYTEALPYLQQALALAERFNGPDSFVVVPYLQRYAYALYHLGRKSEMEQMQGRASTIFGAKI